MMNEQDIQNLKLLLGEDFTDEEVEKLLGEYPGMLEYSPRLNEALGFLRDRPIPSLDPDFTQKVMARLNPPSLWQRWMGRPAWPVRVGLASALAAALVVGAYFYIPWRRAFLESPSQISKQEVIPQDQKIYQVKFSLNRSDAKEVVLIGDFTQWERIILAKDAAGNFSTELTIPQGSYAYGFIVDGKEWVVDPTAHGFLPDGFGRVNSVIHL